jgi:hypothetical protein
VSTPYVRFWYAITVAFVACLITAIASVGYASWVNGQSQKRAEQAQAQLAVAQAQQRAALCGMVVLMDDAYSKTPPSTPAGRNLADAIAVARVRAQCPPR